MSQVAIDTFVFEFQHGIEVRGINSHLARAVARLLADAGYEGARPVVQATTLKPSAENWQQTSDGLMVVVGHPSDAI
jgi:hypothetical protein